MRAKCLAGVIALVLLLAACGPRDVQTPKALLGAWVGDLTWRDGSTSLALAVAADGDSLVASLAAPGLALEPVAIGRLSYAAPEVHLRYAAAGETLAFHGWLRRGILVGTVTGPGLGDPARAALLPQFGFRRPHGRGGLPGVDSSFDETRPVPPPTRPARADTLVHWLHARVPLSDT